MTHTFRNLLIRHSFPKDFKSYASQHRLGSILMSTDLTAQVFKFSMPAAIG